MSLLKKNVIIDFDSEKIAVMENGVLLKYAPASVIRKKSETPVGITYGDEAEKLKNALKDNELYSRPFKNGKISDPAAAKILFKSILHELFGANPFLTINILTSGGLNGNDTAQIENILSSCGYSGVRTIPRPETITDLLTDNGLNCAVYMDSDITEIVVCDNGETLCSHSIDVSTSVVSENLRNKLLADNKLKLTHDAALSALKDCSLFPDDCTQIISKGKDAITTASKSVYFASKDVYPILDSVYSIIADLISATLLDTEKELALNIAKSGILFIGSGTHILGLEEYIYSRLGIPIYVSSNDFAVISKVK